MLKIKDKWIHDFLYRQIVHEQLWLKRQDKARHLKTRLLNEYKTNQFRSRPNVTHISKKVK